MAVRGVDIVKFLMRQGLMVKINDVIDSDTAELVADELAEPNPGYTRVVGMGVDSEGTPGRSPPAG